MLKHIVSTSIALVLASAAITAQAASPTSISPTPIGPAHKIIPSIPIGPAHPSVPANPIQPSQPATAYDALQHGFHGSINADLSRCSLTRNSEIPVDIKFLNAFFSTNDGSKVRLDPDGDARDVYHFSNENFIYTADLKIIAKRFIEIDKNHSKVTIRTEVISGGWGNKQPVLSNYQFNCSNQNVVFSKK